jgi:hypothetical protein
VIANEIIRRVPGIPPTAGRSFDLTREGILTQSDRKILRLLMRLAVPSLPVEAYAGLACLGDLVDFLNEMEERGAVSTDLFGAPILKGITAPSVFMRPYMPQDEATLYFASMEPSNSFRWRFRGQTVSVHEFSSAISAGVLCHYVFCSTASSELVCYAAAYNYDANAAHCTIAVQRLGFDQDHETVVVEALGLFLNYLFETFSIRKVFADIPEYNIDRFGIVQQLVDVEGKRADYYWHAGRYWSELTVSISRDNWERFAVNFFGQLGCGS